MKIACRIQQSRHGVFYYRHQFSIKGVRKERRISLQTKNPTTAKEKSLLISAIMITNKKDGRMHENEQDILKRISSLNQKEMDESLRNLEIIIAPPNGGNITIKADPNNPADIAAMLQASKDFWDSEIGQSMKFGRDQAELAARQTTESLETINAPSPSTSLQTQVVVAGTPLHELIEKFATRKKNTLAPKTLYEYRNHQQMFSDWISIRKNTPAFPIKEIARQDVSDFIDELLQKGLSNQTIQQKYLSSITGLFELAKNSGLWEQDAVFPTYGHKLFTKSTAKKVKEKNAWKEFAQDDLQHIFHPTAYLAQQNPTDFWLPLLGLYTGGRISELCQLLVQDIKLIDHVWAIAITDEDECQRLKTPAAKRTIPIHPALIKIGFLDFVDDMKPFGGMLFPYLTANKFGNFSETPSERFGKYLDTLDVKDPKKVFHSFRSTSNNTLKKSGVAEETRCQYIGHEHETTNSKVYASEHSVDYLLEHVASKLNFDLPLTQLVYPRQLIVETTRQKLHLKEKLQSNKLAKAKLKKST
ncbi:MAG: site-specific integrase [Undibacterium sp.]|uniref:tyrosine-type recombinase/integrase n=1 Tax=Undibacterium sp. TaxID=1914977 RepID=UPI00272538B3|nr:tyrosine-type recombinase/integrase [Undibacterium sp.]MDO8653293.1 site-specific integrase [Undibacterium sp.]